MPILDYLLPGKSKAKKRALLISEADIFIKKLNENKGLPTVSTSLLLNQGEDAYLQTNTTLQETRSVRQYKAGHAGVRLMKGLYIGGSKGTSEGHDEWRVIDRGTLTVTNKKLYFDGSKGDRTIPLKKIVSVNVSLGTIEISSEGRTKSMLFSVGNPYIWGAVINVLNKVDDPKNIRGNIDVTFE